MLRGHLQTLLLMPKHYFTFPVSSRCESVSVTLKIRNLPMYFSMYFDRIHRILFCGFTFSSEVSSKLSLSQMN